MPSLSNFSLCNVVADLALDVSEVFTRECDNNALLPLNTSGKEGDIQRVIVLATLDRNRRNHINDSYNTIWIFRKPAALSL